MNRAYVTRCRQLLDSSLEMAVEFRDRAWFTGWNDGSQVGMGAYWAGGMGKVLALFISCNFLL